MLFLVKKRFHQMVEKLPYKNILLFHAIFVEKQLHEHVFREFAFLHVKNERIYDGLTSIA